MTIAIEDDLLDELFPANIHLDKGLRIQAVSPSIGKHYPDIQTGSHLFHHFDLPGGNDPDFILHRHRRLKTIQLASKCGSYKLTGSVAPHEHGYFLALRHVPTEKSCKENRFRMGDFTPGDPTVQGLMLINLQRAMIEESQETAIELAYERQHHLDFINRIGRALHSVSQDFHNLLSVIKLNCDRLLPEAAGNRRADRILSIIGDAAQRCARLTGPLMQLSDPRYDRLMPVAIDPMLEDNKALLQALGGPNITLTLNTGAGLAEATLNYLHLTDFLARLFINARDAMPLGGEIIITTTIRSHEPDVRCLDASSPEPVAPMGDHIAIAIESSGKAVPIDLPSALEFAHRMGGEACLDSAPDTRPCLRLHFPVTSPAEPKEPGRLYDGPYDLPGVKGRILLVERDPFVQEALVELLETEGYAVTACKTGEQALLANGNAAHDILLTDIALPCKNGAAFASSACERRPALKVVLMCGYMPDKAELMPGWMCIRKPLNGDELLELLSAGVAQPESRSSFCAR